MDAVSSNKGFIFFIQTKIVWSTFLICFVTEKATYTNIVFTCMPCIWVSEIFPHPVQVTAHRKPAKQVCVYTGTCPDTAVCRAVGPRPFRGAGMWISRASNCSIDRLLPGTFLAHTASRSAEHFLVVLHGLAQSRAPECSQENNPESIHFTGCNGHALFVLFRQDML